MRVTLRIMDRLLLQARRDLSRPHLFAAERVGFISCKVGGLKPNGIVLLASEYHPISDHDYVDDKSVGAMIGPGAFRMALQTSWNKNAGMFHVHLHEHHGTPWFSQVDIMEAHRYVPDFWNVKPRLSHGVLVLSHDSVAGLCWNTRNEEPARINEVCIVGAPLQIIKNNIGEKKWRPRIPGRDFWDQIARRFTTTRR
jgi:hypothetical protein